ncbi:XRE family transcriptional regulator [Streptomyces sp. NPDC057702]|uniref:XRE family transcriptional regulator n=1 Tax=unclassified Streptomyces TaxID=2593676 RepID=UPI0036CA0655
MDRKNLSARQLATRIGVTPKTVERWIANDALVPHARNATDTCRVLGVERSMLWPTAVRSAVKTGSDREVVAVYPYRSACPSTTWAELISRAREEITFAGFTNYFLWTQQPQFARTITEKARSGCRVRFLLGDPDSVTTRQREAVENNALSVSARIGVTLAELAKLADSGVEARFSSAADAPSHIALSVFRFDDEALVTPHLATGAGHDSPLLHLRRHATEGMFDRFCQHHVEQVWERGRVTPGD